MSINKLVNGLTVNWNVSVWYTFIYSRGDDDRATEALKVGIAPYNQVSFRLTNENFASRFSLYGKSKRE